MSGARRDGPEYRATLRGAVDAAESRAVDWPAFHARLDAAVSGRLAELRRRASIGHRATTAAGASWWDYAAHVALAAVPLGVVAAFMLFGYLRSSQPEGLEPPLIEPVAIRSTDAARTAFDSALTGAAPQQSVIATLIPVPEAAFLADTVSGGGR